jgi:thioester reductase-like protein
MYERDAAAVGYARSKWVAEHICNSAHETSLRGRVAVVRIGQLCGDTEHGIWNESEAWPLLIASVRYTECLPTLRDEV